MNNDAAQTELHDPALYLNRELSQLEFNFRVLAQAMDERVPLLERLRYLCISCTNLDEFFEIRVAGVFREAPEAFLRMIVVHELAHLKERQHDKAFYQLCEHMEPAYHQLEFDLRLYLTLLDTQPSN